MEEVEQAAREFLRVEDAGLPTFDVGELFVGTAVSFLESRTDTACFGMLKELLGRDSHRPLLEFAAWDLLTALVSQLQNVLDEEREEDELEAEAQEEEGEGERNSTAAREQQGSGSALADSSKKRESLHMVPISAVSAKESALEAEEESIVDLMRFICQSSPPRELLLPLHQHLGNQSYPQAAFLVLTECTSIALRRIADRDMRMKSAQTSVQVLADYLRGTKQEASGPRGRARALASVAGAMDLLERTPLEDVAYSLLHTPPKGTADEEAEDGVPPMHEILRANCTSTLLEILSYMVRTCSPSLTVGGPIPPTTPALCATGTALRERIMAGLARIRADFFPLLASAATHEARKSSKVGGAHPPAKSRKKAMDEEEEEEEEEEDEFADELEGGWDKEEEEEDEAMMELREEMGHVEMPVLGVGLYLHAILSECVGVSQMPFVLHPNTLFTHGRTYVAALLQCDSILEKHSGVQLLAALLARLPRHARTQESLQVDFLNTQTHGALMQMPVPQLLIEFMVRCPFKEWRMETSQTLRMVFHAYDSEARHQLYETLLATCPYDGVAYLLLLWLKDEVIADSAVAAQGQGVFLGESLFRIISLVMRSDKEKAKASITTLYETHMAALNFLLFLLLRGARDERQRVRDNVTGIWHVRILDQVEGSFLSPLQHALTHRIEQLRAEAAKASEAGCGEAGAEGGSKIGNKAGGLIEVALTPQRHTKDSAAQLALKLEVMKDTISRISEVLSSGRDVLADEQ